MALTANQRRQLARAPIIDGSVDGLDARALAGVSTIETTAPVLSSVQLRQLARVPIVDATVDISDKYALAGIAEPSGAGNSSISFSLSWTVDPTFAFSTPTIEVDGSFTVQLGSFLGSLVGTTVGAVLYPIDKIAASTASRHTGIAALHEMIGLSSVSQDSDVSVEGQLTSISVKTVSIDIAITPLGVKIQ